MATVTRDTACSQRAATSGRRCRSLVAVSVLATGAKPGEPRSLAMPASTQAQAMARACGIAPAWSASSRRTAAWARSALFARARSA